MGSLLTLGVILLFVSLVRERIASRSISPPMLFVAAGVVIGPEAFGLLDLDIDDESVILLAEATLAMLLFADAARIDIKALRRSLGLPVRLLGIGLPLSVIGGTVVTGLLLTELSWVEAALVAAILAPTDAALGEAVVSDTRVPVRIRQALNVESGLNDGLVVPAVALFAALAAGEELDGPGALAAGAIVEITLGVIIGLAAGAALGALTNASRNHHLADSGGLRLAALGGVAVGYTSAVLLGGNGFIAAFVAGITLRAVGGSFTPDRTELVEDLGQVGASLTFILFGAMMVIPALEVLSVAVIVCAVAALTIGRMMPVALAMTGTGLKTPTIAFLGWFGPRGLASMIFGLLVVAERGHNADQLFSIISVVILASVILHGVSAAPGASWYSRWFAEHGHDEMGESASVPEVPVRWRPEGRRQERPATN